MMSSGCWPACPPRTLCGGRVRRLYEPLLFAWQMVTDDEGAAANCDAPATAQAAPTRMTPALNRRAPMLPAAKLFPPAPAPD